LCHFSSKRLEEKWHNWYSRALFLYIADAKQRALTGKQPVASPTPFSDANHALLFTPGGCTNFISWRHNNQWLLKITRPKTKLVIKLTQPDARKNAGHGRHYSNAIGFYIFKGNASPTDHNRRKLVLKDGDEEDGGDFVMCKEPRFSRQVHKREKNESEKRF